MYSLVFIPYFFILDSLTKQLSKLIEENSPAHFFLDEVPANELTPYFWSEIHNNFPTENFLWVAYRADTPPHEDILKGNFYKAGGMFNLNYFNNSLLLSLS